MINLKLLRDAVVSYMRLLPQFRGVTDSELWKRFQWGVENRKDGAAKILLAVLAPYITGKEYDL